MWAASIIIAIVTQWWRSCWWRSWWVRPWLWPYTHNKTSKPWPEPKEGRFQRPDLWLTFFLSGSIANLQDALKNINEQLFLFATSSFGGQLFYQQHLLSGNYDVGPIFRDSVNIYCILNMSTNHCDGPEPHLSPRTAKLGQSWLYVWPLLGQFHPNLKAYRGPWTFGASGLNHVMKGNRE